MDNYKELCFEILDRILDYCFEIWVSDEEFFNLGVAETKVAEKQNEISDELEYICRDFVEKYYNLKIMDDLFKGEE